MDIYVVSNVWMGNGATVIGAAVDLETVKEIADRQPDQPEMRGRWAPWLESLKDGSLVCFRSALHADGSLHRHLVQHVVRVPLAGCSEWVMSRLDAFSRIDTEALDHLNNDRPMDVAPPVTLEQMTEVMRTISAMPKPPGKLRCGNGAAWDWLRRGLDQMATYPAKEALPDSIAAQILGFDVVLDPNLPPNVMKLGNKMFVVNGDSVLSIDEAVLDVMRPYPFTNLPG